MTSNSPFAPKTSGFLGVSETLGSTDILGNPTQPNKNNMQVAVNPVFGIFSRAVGFGKNAKNAFDKTPIGKDIKNSSPFRSKESVFRNTMDRIAQEQERAKEESVAKEKAKTLGFGTEDFFQGTRTNKPNRKAKPRPLTYSSFPWLDPQPNQGSVPSASRTTNGYFGDPTYSGQGFQGVGTSGYQSSPDRNSAHGDFGDGHAAGSASSPGSDVGMGKGGMGLGSDTEGAGGWGFPVVLDLDQNGGIEIVPTSQSAARFNITDTGQRHVLAWPGPDDGLLVYDRDGDRLISDKDEIAFKDYLATAETDLEGLAWFDHVTHGGNNDGILDNRDALWAKFGVWRDADQDGETDPGELRMTGEGALSSVNLTSDQQPVDVGPDAQVFGKGTYEYLDSDGLVQTADLYDTALRYDTEVEPEKPETLRLVRRDGQRLNHGEILYPAMAYNDETYETWSAEAIQAANVLYPGFANRQDRQVFS
jgi:hypothetical protein